MASDECVSIKAVATHGVAEERAALEETLCVIRRAGADLIIPYLARDFAPWSREKR